MFNSSLPLPYLGPQSKISTDILLPSVQFHDDSILSRSACEDCIVLWDITGFDSEGRPPSQDEAPTQHEAANGSATLTCFTDPTKNDPYVRLIEYVLFFPSFCFLYFRVSLPMVLFQFGGIGSMHDEQK